jgi:hypothetical protein
MWSFRISDKLTIEPKIIQVSDFIKYIDNDGVVSAWIVELSQNCRRYFISIYLLNDMGFVTLTNDENHLIFNSIDQCVGSNHELDWYGDITLVTNYPNVIDSDQ